MSAAYNIETVLIYGDSAHRIRKAEQAPKRATLNLRFGTARLEEAKKRLIFKQCW